METTDNLTRDTYLHRVTDAWNRTISFAIKHGATEIQVAALADLSLQFGSGSKKRLADLWRVMIDKDGDVVLIFSRQLEANPWTRVVIDPFGVISMKNHKGEEWMNHPSYTRPSDSSQDTKKDVTWTLNFSLMSDVLEPSYRVDEERGLIYISDFSRWFANFIPRGTYKSVWATQFMYNRELEGFARPVGGGKPVYFKEAHRDEVAGVSFFAIYHLSWTDRLKAWMDLTRIRLIVRFKLKPPTKWLFKPSSFYRKKTPIGITIL